MLMDLEKNFSPDSIRVNFEVLNLLQLCMDCQFVMEYVLNDKAKGFK